MKKLLLASIALLCSAAVPAFAFCVTGDPGQGCPQPYANDASQPDGTTTRQGFDAQTGTQWSTTSHKMGDFTFYSGMSSGNPWDSRGRLMENGMNTPNFNSQGQTNSAHCAFFGTC
jgi:hypothetical protein